MCHVARPSIGKSEGPHLEPLGRSVDPRPPPNAVCMVSRSLLAPHRCKEAPYSVPTLGNKLMPGKATVELSPSACRTVRGARCAAHRAQRTAHGTLRTA